MRPLPRRCRDAGTSLPRPRSGEQRGPDRHLRPAGTPPRPVQRFGWLYLLLAVPATCADVLVQQEGKSAQYTIFLAIFIAFLAIEALYDWVLKIPFREQPDWRLLVPYVALYTSSTYGFVVMVWKESVPGGLLMLALAVAQVLANALTHPRG